MLSLSCELSTLRLSPLHSPLPVQQPDASRDLHEMISGVQHMEIGQQRLQRTQTGSRGALRGDEAPDRAPDGGPFGDADRNWEEGPAKHPNAARCNRNVGDVAGEEEVGSDSGFHPGAEDGGGQLVGNGGSAGIQERGRVHTLGADEESDEGGEAGRRGGGDVNVNVSDIRVHHHTGSRLVLLLIQQWTEGHRILEATVVASGICRSTPTTQAQQVGFPQDIPHLQQLIPQLLPSSTAAAAFTTASAAGFAPRPLSGPSPSFPRPWPMPGVTLPDTPGPSPGTSVAMQRMTQPVTLSGHYETGTQQQQGVTRASQADARVSLGRLAQVPKHICLAQC